MTYRPPRHGRHGPVARVRARVAGWLDRIGRRYEWDEEWDGLDDDGQPIADVLPPAPEAQGKDPDGMPAGWAALHDELAGHGERLPDAGERTEMFAQLAPEALRPPSAGELDPDAPWCHGCGFANYSAGPCEVCGHDDQQGVMPDVSAPEGTTDRATPETEPGPGEETRHGRVETGLGFFHDDAPAEVVPAVQLSDGSYAGLRGTIRGPLYGAKRWPMPPAADTPTAVDMGDQPRAGAPAWRPQRPALPGWVTDILGAPSVDAWVWGWQQKRRLAIGV